MFFKEKTNQNFKHISFTEGINYLRQKFIERDYNYIN